MAFHGYVTPKGRERIIAREQTSGAPVDIRASLGNDVFVGLCKYREGKRAGILRMKESGKTMFREAREQLRILDAIHYGYIKPAPGCGRAS